MADMIDRDGVVLTRGDVEYAYTREGRKEIGLEYPNPVPLEPPLGYIPSKPLHEQIREMVIREMSRAAEAEELETAEEADDFDVGDDYDPESPYEHDFEPTDPWPPRPEVKAAEEAAVEAKVEAGGGGAQPPSDEPASPAGAPTAKP